MVYYGDDLGDRPKKNRDRRQAAIRRQERRQARREWAASLRGDEAREAAKEAALRLLDRQDRSVGECRAKLDERGFHEEAIDAALDRLVELDLLNDERYARMLVRTRHAERGLVGRALVEQLHRKQIPPHIIEVAMEEVDEESIRSVAMDFAQRRIRSMASVERDRKFRRLVSMLARKGYSPGLAISVVTELLEEGDGVE
ncbi:MAG: regulatory protein RecX [Actinomycetaceae bacterium]|nr:regulatory protein RecX [Actinomycetaceae bacterium]